MSDHIEEFMTRLEGNDLLYRRIELACDTVGFEAGRKEIQRIAQEEGVTLTDEQIGDVLDRLCGI